MKIKTSLSLDEAVLAGIDKLAAGRSRSAVIEHVLREHLMRRARARARARELAGLNEQADKLNSQAADVLEYQAAWAGE